MKKIKEEKYFHNFLLNNYHAKVSITLKRTINCGRNSTKPTS